MKFFFNFSELGSCCRPQATTAEFPAAEEGGVCASVGHAPPKRGGRCSASGQWRPGLPAISEVGVAAAVRVAGTSNQTARRKPPGRVVGSTAKNRSYNTSGGPKDESRLVFIQL